MDTLTRGELIAALAMAVAFFVFAYAASPRKSIPFILCLTPFEPIVTQYGTSNVLLVYVLAIAYMLRGRISYLPLLGIFFLIMAAYVLSTGFAPASRRVAHAIYIFNFGSAVLLFYVVYNFVRQQQDVVVVLVRTFIVLNVLFLLYCLIQLSTGTHLMLFDFGYLSIKPYREDMRLTGPFESAQNTGEYLALSILALAYMVVQARIGWRRMFLYLLIAANFACLIATGTRAAFLILVGGAGLFLFLFRNELGTKRTIGIAFSGLMVLAMVSVVIVNFTQFGNLFDRLEQTEFESGVPDTRVGVWTNIYPRIAEKPLVGNGPMYDINVEGMSLPHNLYLFLLYTVGGVGLMIYLLFFGLLLLRYRAGAMARHADPMSAGIARLGVVLLVAFLVDQITIEALRMATTDYWHYIFATFAICLAFADMARAGVKAVPDGIDIRSRGPAASAAWGRAVT